MGRQTNRSTADEIGEGQSLRSELRDEVEESIEELNNAQLGRLDRLRDFIAEDKVSVRVRNPENGYFHAGGPRSEHRKTMKTGALTMVRIRVRVRR